MDGNQSFFSALNIEGKVKKLLLCTFSYICNMFYEIIATFSLCSAAQPQSVGLIAGTIATGVLAVIIFLLVAAVTLFYWKNKNKYDEEEIPNEIRFGFCSL